MPETAAGFYDADYFARQAQHGEIQARANLFKFAEFIKPGGNVLDFGCGGGFLLSALDAEDRIGIEINPTAIAHAKSIGIPNVFPDICQVADEWADYIVSDHAMEHVENPSNSMKEFFRVLKPGGTMVIVTPYDGVSTPYRENDPDRHLFGWSPSNLGNLGRSQGFKVIEAKEICHRWPPKWETIWRRLGPSAFHLTSQVYGRLRRDRTQVRLVATK